MGKQDRMTFDHNNAGPPSEGNPFPPAAPFTMEPYNPNRALLRRAGFFLAGIIVGLGAIAAVMSTAPDDSADPAQSNGSITPVTTKTATTRAETTTTIDSDADCKAAMQTPDVNAPFAACTGPQYDRLLTTYGSGKPERRPACQYANMGPACAGIPVTTTTTRPVDSLRSIWGSVDIDTYYAAIAAHGNTLSTMADDPIMAVALWDSTMVDSYQNVATATATFIGDVQAAADTANLSPADRSLIDRMIASLRQVQSTHQAVAACREALACTDKMRSANQAITAATAVMAEMSGAM